MVVETVLIGWGAGMAWKALQKWSPSTLPRGRPWELPPLDLIDPPSGPSTGLLAAYADTLTEGLAARGVAVDLLEIRAGPSVLRFELELGQGQRMAGVTKLRGDIAYLLGDPNPRILETVGAGKMAIEIPNPDRQIVKLSNVLGTNRPGVLEIAIGLDINGDPVTDNLARMPHLLIAGQTGGGKSTFLHSLLVSLLLGATPDDMQLVLIDPKRVELSDYERLPHLWRPVVTELDETVKVLGDVVEEMSKRYTTFQRSKVRNIGEYHAKGKSLPYLVVVIDELAVLTANVIGIDHVLARIAAEGRAAGIHMVVATQRPSVKVITGDIKANVPARVAFAVKSHVDSKVILDAVGAEKLQGNGDMLYGRDAMSIERAQGAYVTQDEIRKVVQWWTKRK